MSERHPPEIELAQFSESRDVGKLEGHLRWCSRCRRILADYGWLQGEIASVLEAKASAAAVPQPNWDAVRKGVGRAERRSERGQLVVFAGAALAACLMLAAPLGFGGRVEAQGMPAPPVAVTAPPPARVDDSLTGTRPRENGRVISTRAQPPEGSRTSLPFVPPPTPPACES